jgi:hypothetical protein
MYKLIKSKAEEICQNLENSTQARYNFSLNAVNENIFVEVYETLSLQIDKKNQIELSKSQKAIVEAFFEQDNPRLEKLLSAYIFKEGVQLKGVSSTKERKEIIDLIFKPIIYAIGWELYVRRCSKVILENYSI